MPDPPPLQGLRVIEFAGLAPAPYCGMLLTDAGASLLRIDRAIPNQTHDPSQTVPPTNDILARRKSSIAVDLKSPSGVALIKKIVVSADILIDPFRPGVLEKLGLGPDTLLKINPRLIYGRVTGFRRDGKYAMMAGHDINYLAVSGTLSLLGREGQKPHAPGNILADFAGGGANLFQGILLAVVARATSGKGQVVEANMVDGSSHLATFPRMALKRPLGGRGRGRNLLDGGCPWYDTYETKDGRYMAVGALEPQFFKELIKGLGLSGQGWEDNRFDISRWQELKNVFEAKFKTKSRTEWEIIFDGTDACCTPVLTYPELETEKFREGDQRPSVSLRDSPCLSITGEAGGDHSIGVQGEGVLGGGYEPSTLGPGVGGEVVLERWFGWRRGEQYDVQKGGLILTPTGSKL